MKKENIKINKNKFLLIVSIAILIITIFFNNVSFGATYDLSDYKNHISSANQHWCIVRSLQNNKFYLLVAGSEWRHFYTDVATFNNIECSSGYFYINGYKPFGYYTFNEDTKIFENYTQATGNNTVDLGYCEIIASFENIFYRGQEGNVFFQQTPVPSQVFINPTLMETITQALVEMMQKIVANLKIIMTVGLVLLSIGLVILLIKSVILRVT